CVAGSLRSTTLRLETDASIASTSSTAFPLIDYIATARSLVEFLREQRLNDFITATETEPYSSPMFRAGRRYVAELLRTWAEGCSGGGSRDGSALRFGLSRDPPSRGRYRPSYSALRQLVRRRDLKTRVRLPESARQRTPRL